MTHKKVIAHQVLVTGFRRWQTPFLLQDVRSGSTPPSPHITTEPGRTDKNGTRNLPRGLFPRGNFILEWANL